MTGVLLAVALYTPLSADELETLRASLAWAHIAAIRVLKALPVDARHNAKIDYAALRRELMK